MSENTTDTAQGTGVPEDVRLPLAKIALDKTLAALLLVATLPISAVIALAVLIGGLLWREDRGPVLHREIRVSQGRPFRLYKFRILTTRALEEDLGAGRLTPKEVENVPGNLTRVGKLLKKTGLDEIPQFVNILAGDMTLVGPRPKPVPEYEEEIARGIYRRKVARAGLSGPVQVRKGTERTYEEEVAADDAYIEVLRTGGAFKVLATDLAMIAKTIRVLLKMTGE